MSYNMFPDYQALERGTEGVPGKANRSIPDRIVEYGMDKVLDKTKSVFDFGCNRGYFGICLSQMIGKYTGLDSDSNQLQFGISEAAKRGYENVRYISGSYSPNTDYGKHDIIICCAFHIYVDVAMEVFARHLVNMLNDNGDLFLEGHPPGYHLPNNTNNEPEHYWNPLTAELDKKLRRIETKRVRDRELSRPFIHYKLCV